VSGWRRFATSLTPALVTLWAAFLVLGTLQPCCEAVADAFVAGGAVSLQSRPHQAMAGAHEHAIDGSAPGHTHCGQTLFRHTELKALNSNEAGKGNEVHPAAAAIPVAPQAPVLETPAVRPRSASDRERSPPLPVYLATLRLRL